MFSFNLIERPWIPCLTKTGQAQELSLRDVFLQSPRLATIQGETPPETVALYRLLLAILHRNFETRTSEQWRKLRDMGEFDTAKLNVYLDKWLHRFDLFGHERPFYQSDDDRANPKSVVSLLLHMVSGANAVLFDHHTEQEGATLTPGQAARAVLTAQAFAVGGLSGMDEKFTDAPCAKGVLFLAMGDSLFETLLFNLVRYYDTDPMPNDEDDMPAWEMKDPFKKRLQPKGYIDYLTWHNRRILLLPEETSGGAIVVRQMKWAPGLRLEAEEIDPMKRYLRDKNKKQAPRVLQFSASRALWRDCDTLFVLDNPDYIKPPAVFRHLANLTRQRIVPYDKTLRFMALGMAKDRAKLEFFRAETLPLPLKYLQDNQFVVNLIEQLHIATETSGKLYGALTTLARFILSPNADQSGGREPDPKDITNLRTTWDAEGFFWSGLERPFHELLITLPDTPEEARAAWREALERRVRQAFDRAVQGVSNSPRAYKAIAQAETQLDKGLKEIFK